MKYPHPASCLFFGLLMAFCSISNASAQYQSTDVSGSRSANALILARLIKEHAFFTGGVMGFRYDTHVNATQGLKLYVSEQMKIYGSWSTPDLYYIDFEQPIKTDELKLHRGKKGYFTLEASKRITRKVKRRVRNGQVKERERNARLYIVFAAKTKETYG
ncbi:hypothetical protein [Siphonobacter sp. BAB-5385]|uniref:hypothetical protein n=1 Tax=Siphonobacter sp. BAB-5385 TaxID=1864822 RepID=UPI0011406F19|nr:hypothetical protein [Siphonobacter sp. BAB-5385]